MREGQRSAGERGQSPVVGVVLLFGFVVVVGSVVMLLGSVAIGDLQTAVGVENAEHTMREVDSRLSQVVYSANDVQVLDFSGSGGRNITVTSGSHMNITVNESAACRATIEMGAVVERTDDGRAVAYEGGGVWKQTDGGTVMVSPPDFQYQNGTINFPVVSVSGGAAGRTDRLRVRKNQTASVQQSREISETFANCSPPGNVTIAVQSDYYRAWGRYFEQVVGGNVTLDDANERATIKISRLGDETSANVAGTNLTASTDYVAKIKINGTAYHANEFHLPFAFRVDIEDRGPKTFSADPTQSDGVRLVDRGVDMSYDNVAGGVPVADDMNNPNLSYENGKYPTESITVDGGQSFSVVGISYYCSPTAYGNELERADGGGDEPDWENVSNENGDGMLDEDPAYPSRSGGVDDRCIANGLDERELRNLSSTGGSDNLWAFNSTNNHVTARIDYDEFTSGSAQQRNVDEILGPIYQEVPDDAVAGYSDADSDPEILLDLDANQAVYVYEFNEDPDTDPDVTDGDFNDAVVLVSVYEQGAINPNGNFYLKISFNEVEVAEA
jgi:flagellin-like protein